MNKVALTFNISFGFHEVLHYDKYFFEKHFDRVFNIPKRFLLNLFDHFEMKRVCAIRSFAELKR